MEDIIEINGQKYRKMALTDQGNINNIYIINGFLYSLIQEVENTHEWEVLTLRKYSSCYTNGFAECTLRENGKYLNVTNEGQGCYDFKTVYEDSWQIHSVKRLKDGEVFTIGDKCHLSNGNGCRNPILRFEISYNEYGPEKYRNKETLKFVLGTGLHDKREWGPFELDICVHSPKPLFKTEDGIDIYPGDTCYEVQKDNLKRPPVSWINIPSNISNLEWDMKDYLYFSTEEAALAWLEENKTKPLFITDDGVELWKKDDKVYSVCPKSVWETKGLNAGFLHHSRNSFEGGGHKQWKHFSSEEARDKYIFENKPVFSFNDVIKFTMPLGIGTIWCTEEVAELKKLVSTKI